VIDPPPLPDGRKVRRRVRLDPSMPRRAVWLVAKRISKDAESYVFDPHRGRRGRAAVLIDESLPRAVGRVLAAAGHDVIDARDVGLRGVPMTM